VTGGMSDNSSSTSYAVSLANESYGWYKAAAIRSRRAYRLSEALLLIISAGIPVSAAISPHSAIVPAVLGGVVVVLSGLQVVFHWHDNYLRFSTARTGRRGRPRGIGRGGGGRRPPGRGRQRLPLLRDPDLAGRITADFARAGMAGEAVNCLTGYLAAISRKLPRPLAVIVQSTSAAGKSAPSSASGQPPGRSRSSPGSTRPRCSPPSPATSTPPPRRPAACTRPWTPPRTISPGPPPPNPDKGSGGAGRPAAGPAGPGRPADPGDRP
jgi:hypothetical protein